MKEIRLKVEFLELSEGPLRQGYILESVSQWRLEFYQKAFKMPNTKNFKLVLSFEDLSA